MNARIGFFLNNLLILLSMFLVACGSVHPYVSTSEKIIDYQSEQNFEIIQQGGTDILVVDSVHYWLDVDYDSALGIVCRKAVPLEQVSAESLTLCKNLDELFLIPSVSANFAPNEGVIF